MFSIALTALLTFLLLSSPAVSLRTEAHNAGPLYSIVDDSTSYSQHSRGETDLVVRFKRYANNGTEILESGVASNNADNARKHSLNDDQDTKLSSTTIPPHVSSDRVDSSGNSFVVSGKSGISSMVNESLSDDENKILEDTNELKSVEGGNNSVNDSAEFNVTLVEDEEHHNYYTSRVILARDNEADDYWLNESVMSNTHSTLSASYRSAATIQLSFPFQFYGHELKQVTIATGGFLYMSDFLHQWLTATQYIAPLMANFDTQIGNESHIRYYDNGTVFVVWWKDIFLQDYMDAGLFNFQTMLHKDGRIIFSYKQVPDWSAHASYDWAEHVIVGLSDAYYMDYYFMPYMRQRTIYEYHRVEINMSRISSRTAVVISPLVTCVSMKTCSDCVNSSVLLGARFQCQWCSALRRCSDGLDRLRQEWLEKSCDKKASQTEGDCEFELLRESIEVSEAQRGGRWRGGEAPVNVAGYIFLTLFLFAVVASVLWIVYAYRYPNSPSGLWLIQHRPEGLLERVRQVRERCRVPLMTLRSGGRRRSAAPVGSDKYEVAMQPETEEILT